MCLDLPIVINSPITLVRECICILICVRGPPLRSCFVYIDVTINRPVCRVFLKKLTVDNSYSIQWDGQSLASHYIINDLTNLKPI